MSPRNFTKHTVGRNLLPLFREHDHNLFFITCYANMPCADEFTAHFQKFADSWHNVLGLDDDELSKLVRKDRIDILVDLTLHMGGNRLLTFARKAELPIQVTFAGYPGTTGLSAIDYRLTDPYLDPTTEAADRYSEESLRLPHSFWCYDPWDCTLQVNQLPALRNGFVTFGCLNNFCKVNAPTLSLWAKILAAIPDSRLEMLAPLGEPRNQVLGLLEKQGINADRIIFVARQPRLRYLELYHQIDVGLDTLPYNGHTTSLDAAWMGVPVVTLAGQTVVGRAGVTLNSNLGLRELIARTPEEFVNEAVRLAADLPRLNSLRAGLRQRMEQSSLMDSKLFATGIEDAYRTTWQKWCDKDETISKPG